MIGKIIAFFVGLIGAIAAWFAIVRRKDIELDHRVEQAREEAQKRNDELSEDIEKQVEEIKVEIDEIEDRNELARLLDQ